MAVAGDETGARRCGESYQVVVARIRRPSRGRVQLESELGSSAKKNEELLCFLRADPFTDTRVRERALELGKQLLRYDKLDVTLEASLQELGRSALGREESRDEDVRIENDPRQRVSRDACFASSARAIASCSLSSLRAQTRSRRSSPRSRRRASSMTSLSPLPVRAALTFTARRTRSSIVSVVRAFDIGAS
jgi:hypothetical protein